MAVHVSGAMLKGGTVRPNLLLAAVRLGTEMIAVDMQPMSMVEDVGFNVALMACIEPDYKMPNCECLDVEIV